MFKQFIRTSTKLVQQPVKKSIHELEKELDFREKKTLYFMMKGMCMYGMAFIVCMTAPLFPEAISDTIRNVKRLKRYE